MFLVDLCLLTVDPFGSVDLTFLVWRCFLLSCLLDLPSYRVLLFSFILEWKFSSYSPGFCVHRRIWNLLNVSFLISLNVSCNCITSASVVHFATSLFWLLWWNIFFHSVPSDRYNRFFTLLSISSHLEFYIIGAWSSIAKDWFFQSTFLFMFRRSGCPFSAVVSSGSAGSEIVFCG